MGFCKKTSKKYLLLANSLLSIMGLALLGLGVYGMVQYKDTLDDVGPMAQYVPLIAGVIVLVASILGCYGSYMQSKPLLIIYFAVLFVSTALVLAMGSTLLVYLAYADDVISGTDLTSTAKNVNDYQMAVFATCCGTTVAECTDIVTSGCAFDLVSVETRSTSVPDELCNTLEQVSIDGIAVIGPITCSQSPVVFQALFQQYFEDNALPIGITFIVLSVLLFFANIFTCVLICSNRYDYDAKYRAEIQQQEGGQLTGTGTSNVKYV